MLELYIHIQPLLVAIKDRNELSPALQPEDTLTLRCTKLLMMKIW